MRHGDRRDGYLACYRHVLTDVQMYTSLGAAMTRISRCHGPRVQSCSTILSADTLALTIRLTVWTSRQL